MNEEMAGRVRELLEHVSKLKEELKEVEDAEPTFEAVHHANLLSNKLLKDKEHGETLFTEIASREQLQATLAEQATMIDSLTSEVHALQAQLGRVIDIMGQDHIHPSDLVNVMIDAIIALQGLDTIQAKTMKECVSKMIAHEKRAHPELPQKQIIAIAFSKCRERFGG